MITFWLKYQDTARMRRQITPTNFIAGPLAATIFDQQLLTKDTMTAIKVLGHTVLVAFLIKMRDRYYNFQIICKN